MQLLIKLEDNRLIETVGIPVEDAKGSVRLTACVSSQVIFWPVNQSMPTFVPFPRSILLLIQGTVFMHNSIENIYCSVLRLLTCVLCAFILDIQVGCPLRCSFCATGKGGFSRNLKRHEIIEQVTLMSFPCPLFEVHCVVGWWGLWMFYCLRNSEKWSGQSRIEVFHSEEWKKKKKGN